MDTCDVHALLARTGGEVVHCTIDIYLMHTVHFFLGYMCCKCSTGRSRRRGCTLYSRYIALMYTVQFMSGISVLYALLVGAGGWVVQ